MHIFKKIMVLSALLMICSSQKVQTYPHIPLTGLFKVLKQDDIGFGHSLLHSKWIENIYQYGAGKAPGAENKAGEIGKDPVANLIRQLWFRFDESHSLEPTQYGVQSCFTPELFGVLINTIYTNSSCLEQVIERWSDVFVKSVEQLKIELAQLKEEQNECVKVVKKVDQCRKQVELLEKQLKDALKIENGQRKDYVSANETFKELGVDWQKKRKTLGRKEGNFVKSKNRIQEWLGQLRIKQLELLRVNRELELVSKVDNKEKIKKIDSKLRQIGRDFSVKNLAKPEVGPEKLIKPVKEKIEEIIKNILDAIEFCNSGKIYISRTVQAVLWAFFFHKIDKDYISLMDKINAITLCLAQIDSEFKNPEFKNNVSLELLYDSKNDFAPFEEKIKELEAGEQIKMLNDDYDLSLHFLTDMVNGKFPQVVGMGNHGFEYEEGKLSGTTRPDCYETAMHDLFSILWCNSQTKSFDNGLFDERVLQAAGFKKITEALKYFYLADCKGILVKEYTVDNKFTSLAKLKKLGKISPQEVKELSLSKIPTSYMSCSVMKQAFMNIVSGLEGIVYDSVVNGEKIFELKPSVQNFIRLCNYLYGTQVENVADIGKALSTKDREIRCKLLDDKKDAPNTIEISVYDKKNDANFNMTVNIQTGHVSLDVPGRKRLASLKNDVAISMLSQSPMFTLLGSTLLADKKVVWDMPNLHLVYCGLALKIPEAKLEVIEDILERHPELYDSFFKDMVLNLIEKFPRDDRALKCKLSAIFVRSGFYEKEKVFENFVNYVLDDSKIYRCSFYSSPVKFILLAVLEKQYKDIALKIVNYHKFNPAGMYKSLVLAWKHGYENVAGVVLGHPAFSDWGRALTYALKKEWEDVALEIVNHHKFDVTEYNMGICWCLASEKGYNKVAETILNSHNFGGWNDVLKYVLEKNEEDIALKIVNHCNFDVTYNMGICWCLASEKGYNKVAKTILNSPKFREWNDVLKYVLEKNEEDIALNFVKHSNFDASRYGMYKNWILALEKGYNKVAETILNSPKFGGWSDVLKYVLEKNEEDIALNFVKHSNFDASRYDMYKNWILASEKGYNKVAETILNSPNFEGWSDVLKYVLEKNEEDIALNFVKHSNFDASRYDMYKNWILASEKGYNKVAETILNSPNFEGWSDVLKYVLEKNEEEDIALNFVKHSNFDASRYGMYKNWILALEKGYNKVAETILNSPKFREWNDVLKYVLENEREDIALKIVNHCNFDATYNMGICWCLASEKGYNKVAETILNSPNFEGWSDVLKYVLEKNEEDIALNFVKHSNFDASRYDMYKNWILASEKGYNKVAETILNSPNFEGWSDVLKYVLEKNEEDIALKILNHSECNVCKMGEVLVYALKNGYNHIAERISENSQFNDWYAAFFYSVFNGNVDLLQKILKCSRFDCSKINDRDFISLAGKGEDKLLLDMIKHKTFDISGRDIPEIIKKAKELAEKDENRREALQEIVKLLESKQKEALENQSKE